jgi:stage V sporulation protein AE
LEYIYSFLIGGFICMIGQILIDKTKLTPARIMVIFVVSGVVLTAVGVYEPIVKFAESGATVPIVGFGYSLAKGVEQAVKEQGIIGIITGGLKATSGGIGAAIFFGYVFSLISKSRMK